jgi:hypothetical protein
MAFASYRAITIPAANIPSSQTDFPFLFTGTYAFLIDAAHGGTVRSAAGNDIVFATDTAGTMVLDFERVFYRASDGRCQFRIRTQPTAGVDYILYVCFDDATVASYLGNAAGGTWGTPWRSVYHLGDGTTLSLVDSTANGNTLTVQHGAVAATGQPNLDGGVSATGASDCLSFVNTTSVRVQTPFAIRAWVYLTSYRFGAIFTLFDGLGNYNYQLGSNSGAPFFIWRNGASTPFLQDPSTIPLNTWTQLTVRVTGVTAVKFWVNNVNTSNQTSGISVPAMFSGGTGFLAGDNGTSGLDGVADEVMLYNGLMSDDLESMLYANEFSPATFYNVTTAIAWTSECTIAIAVGFAAHGTAAYGPSCAIPIGVGCGASTSIGYGGASCTIAIGAGVSAHATVDYESAKCTIPIVVHVGAIASIGTVPLTCLTGSGTGAAVIPPGVDPGWAY